MMVLASATIALAMQAATPIEQAQLVANEQFTEEAYKDFSQGQAAKAIAKMEIMRAEKARDPALLINLGSAYSELGMTESAREAFAAAAKTCERVDLEMVNGEWVDSRRLARKALASLERHSTLAMR